MASLPYTALNFYSVFLKLVYLRFDLSLCFRQILYTCPNNEVTCDRFEPIQNNTKSNTSKV